MVAAIGVAGIAIGQLINSWRERSRDVARIQLEQVQNIRTQRLELYLSYLESLDAWQHAISEWINCLYSRDDWTTAQRTVHEAQAKMRRLLTDVSLVGSREVHAELDFMGIAHDLLGHVVMVSDRTADIDSDAASNTTKIEFLKQADLGVGAAKARVIELMRKDLQIG